MKTLTIAFMTLLLPAAFCFAGDSTEAVPEKAEKPAKMVDKAATEVIKVGESAEKAVKKSPIITTESGLRYQDVVVGTGVEATDKMAVACHYTLWFADSTGLQRTQKVQSSKDRGLEFNCRIGQGLIPGWSEGMIGMKEGGTRVLYVPWELGYGEKGFGEMIPAKQNLIFELDFVKQTANKMTPGE